MSPQAAPMKSDKRVSREKAARILVAVSIIAAIFKTTRALIKGKRSSGEKGRALRRLAIAYARGTDVKIWECAQIFDLDEKQIGEEEKALLDMVAEDEALDESWTDICAACDAAIKVEPAGYLTGAIAWEREALIRKGALEAARAVGKIARAVQAALPPPPPRPPSEAQRLLAEIRIRDAAKKRAQDARICAAVMANAAALPGERRRAERTLAAIAVVEFASALLTPAARKPIARAR